MQKSIIYNRPVTIHPAEQEHIEQYILGPYFPWHWQGMQTSNDDNVAKECIPLDVRPSFDFYNGPFLSHVLLRREEEETAQKHITSNDAYEFFMEIFHRFIKENQLSYTKIYRANLNLTWYNGDLHTAPHLDHSWPHKNFIMYLTSCDDGQTLIWSNDFLTTHVVPCNKYTAVTFDAHYHAHRYPELHAKRVVFVVTYI